MTANGNQSGRRLFMTSRAVSGRVVRYQRNTSTPAMAEPIPSQASLRATSFLKAGSGKRAATMPPTTAVMVNMKAVRMASWAKVLGP